VIEGGRVLAARRRKPNGGWEFPGGKIEPGESPDAAVERELREELGVTVHALTAVASAHDDRIDLQLWQAMLVTGTPEPRADHDALVWLAAGELDDLAWLPVDRELLVSVRALLATSAQRAIITGMRFRTTVELGGKTATGIEVPDDVVAALGDSKRPAVTITINGYAYRTTVARMAGRFLVPLSAENRSRAGVAAGDEVDVEIALDTAPRTTELPADLAAALDDAARNHYDALAPTHQKEWVRWVEEAKRPETRATRIQKTAQALHEGRTAR
jgi:ADP-ribose pyrophosphatase YjhB (NUDIX family)